MHRVWRFVCSNIHFDPLKSKHGAVNTGNKFVSKFIRWIVNHLNPSGYVMHQQFNIQQLYALPTLYLCVLYLSENKQRLVPLTA